MVYAGEQNTPSPGGQVLSHTELYVKYVDATQQSRQERTYRHRTEVLLEQVFATILARLHSTSALAWAVFSAIEAHDSDIVHAL